MDYFKLKGHKVRLTASYGFCLGIDNTLTLEQWQRLTGNVKKKKPVKVTYKKSEKKVIKDKSLKEDLEEK